MHPGPRVESPGRGVQEAKKKILQISAVPARKNTKSITSQKLRIVQKILINTISDSEHCTSCKMAKKSLENCEQNQ